MVTSPDRGGVFDVLLRLARLGLGGPVAGGARYVSWIHDRDFVRAVDFHVVPGRLLEAHVTFDHRQWPAAADDLVRRLRGRDVR